MVDSVNKDGILLETGTNELEIIIFKVDNRKFGVNVSKVQEIIKKIPYTKVPKSHEYIKGLINPRGQVIPLLDLNRVLTGKSNQNDDCLYINLEFNNSKISVEVDEVIGIKKISWKQIEKINVSIDESLTSGVVKLDSGMIIMIDFEKILVDVIGNVNEQIEFKEERKNIEVLFAEDSNIIALAIKDGLLAAGYQNITEANDGEKAWELIQKKSFDVIISDLEMPKLDGYALTKRVKKEFPETLVVLFSSLITNENMHKGESVGADLQINKPSVNVLIEKLDVLLNIKD